MMTSNLKVLGLALVAMLAMAAVTASAASAQGKLTSDGNVTLTAEETGGIGANALEAFGSKVECPGSTYTGHALATTPHGLIASGATTATLTPHYKEVSGGSPNCSGPLGTKLTIDMNGCDYVIHLGATTAGTTEYATTFDVVCPVNKEITLTLFGGAHTAAPLCDLHIPPQVGLKGVDARNTTGGHVGLIGTVEKIKVKQTRTSILCPAGTEELGAKLKLDLTVKGHNAVKAATAISLSD